MARLFRLEPRVMSPSKVMSMPVRYLARRSVLRVGLRPPGDKPQELTPSEGGVSFSDRQGLPQDRAPVLGGNAPVACFRASWMQLRHPADTASSFRNSRRRWHATCHLI